MLFTPVSPMLAAWGDEPFDEEAYMFEPKWDGHRLLLHKQGDRVALFTRSGQQVTDRFPEAKEAAAAIRAHTAVLDGEGVVMREGIPAFDDMSYRLRIRLEHKIKSAVRTHPFAFIAFDMLYADDSVLMEEPLIDRKRRLEEALPPTPLIMPTLCMEGRGRALYELTRSRNLEGIVAKRSASVYRPGQVSEDWVKVKHARTIDTIVLGYRADPFELVLGLNFRTVPNKPVGIVQAEPDEADRHRFLTAAAPLHRQHDGRTQWLEPGLCCRIRYRDRTDLHQLQRTEFVQFLWDKRPEACVWGSP
ncbi:DNA ligase [Paenibacillus sp. HJGM_3]|uniref:ATP-dependent DNA ligase n=1 Tax=Paenibacillus sp. HJGM_3 TaxID=3379816 RepID=UPI003859CDF4